MSHSIGDVIFMWFFRKCGAENLQDSNYCQKCGTPKEPIKKVVDPKDVTIVVLAVIIVVLGALLILFIYGGDKPGINQNSYKSLFDDYSKLHPEYSYSVQLDLDGNAVPEQLFSEREDGMFARLCTVSQDGKRINSWYLTSRFGDYRYDVETKRLAVHSGGTGRAEYCFIKLSGDALEVWHVGRTSDSQEGYFYAFTETIPSGDEEFLHYSYGEKELGRLDYDFLSKNKVSVAEYDKWEEKYNLLPVLERLPNA